MRFLIRNGRFLVLLLLAILVVANLPARSVHLVLPDRIKLSGLSGSIWSGNATRAWILIKDKPIMLGQVSWQLLPWRVLWSSPLQVSSNWGAQTFSARIGYGLDGDLNFRDLRLHLDARVFRTFLPLYLGGVLTTDLRKLSIKGNTVTSVEGFVSLSQAVWTARNGHLPLGTYRVAFGARDDSAGVLQGIISTQEGALTVSGEVELTPDSYRVALDATGPTARDESFLKAMAMVAMPTSNGFKIVLEGH